MVIPRSERRSIMAIRSMVVAALILAAYNLVTGDYFYLLMNAIFLLFVLLIWFTDTKVVEEEGEQLEE